MCIVRGGRFSLWAAAPRHCPGTGVSGVCKTKDLVPYAVGFKPFTLPSGALGKAPSKVTDALPEPEPAGAMAASEEGEEEEDEEDLEAMQSRLATLRS